MDDADLVVFWTPAIETACVRARQRRPDPPPPRPDYAERRRRVERALRNAERGWLSIDGLRSATGLSADDVGDAAYALIKAGAIARRHPLVHGGRGQRVQEYGWVGRPTPAGTGARREGGAA